MMLSLPEMSADFRTKNGLMETNLKTKMKSSPGGSKKHFPTAKRGAKSKFGGGPGTKRKESDSSQFGIGIYFKKEETGNSPGKY